MNKYNFYFNEENDCPRLKEQLDRIEQHQVQFHLALSDLKQNQIAIMKSQAELVTQLSKVTAQLNKISIESSKTLAKVDELQAALDNEAEVSDELQAAVDALVKQVQIVDDLVPDVTGPISNGSGVSNGSGSGDSPQAGPFTQDVPTTNPVLAGTVSTGNENPDPNASGPGDTGNTTGNAGKFGVQGAPR